MTVCPRCKQGASELMAFDAKHKEYGMFCKACQTKEWKKNYTLTVLQVGSYVFGTVLLIPLAVSALRGVLMEVAVLSVTAIIFFVIGFAGTCATSGWKGRLR